MKKVLLAIGLLASIAVASSTNSCKGCHGQNFEKKALGKSKVVADMNATEIYESLIGYKDGTYGGPMKGVMIGQVSKYSDLELDIMSKDITMVKEKVQE
jgi:cytochrome c